jgi:hypothetical protein
MLSAAAAQARLHATHRDSERSNRCVQEGSPMSLATDRSIPRPRSTGEVKPDQVIDLDYGQTVDLVRQQIAVHRLDLSEMTILVGAATGYRAAAATAAVLAGAKQVIAVCRGPRGHPAATDSAAATQALARAAGVFRGIEIVSHVDSKRWMDFDIIAHCPQIGPITRSVIELLSPDAVISLMAEPWELRPGVVDLQACAQSGIKVAAPDLSHPAVQLLPDLARLSCALLDRAGIEAMGANIAIISDTSCAPFIESALRERGAQAHSFAHPSLLFAAAWDAILVAMRPSDKPPMNINNLGRIFECGPDAVLVQFSGEIDRSAVSYFGMKIWPEKKPNRGELGLPLDVLGPGPTVRKVTAGFKSAEIARRLGALGNGSIGYLVDPEVST